MLINDIKQMEDIVNKHRHLSWAGWSVVSLKQDDYAEYLSEGFFDKSTGRWYRKSVYSCGDNGWEIPDSVLL